MQHFSDSYDRTNKPYVATMAHDQEAANEPEHQNPDVAPHTVLVYLMEEPGVSQYQLAQEVIAGLDNDKPHADR